jgi:hypothetical protein
MPRVYRNQSTESSDESEFILTILRFEIITGAFLLMVGGFVLRVRADYSLIVMGGTLLGLGIFRLSRHQGYWKRDSAMEDDRILRALNLQLDSNYTVAVNYSISEDYSVPYLVLGPTGMFILDSWSEKGTVREGEEDHTWDILEQENDDQDPTITKTVDNPLRRQNQRRRALNQKLAENGLGGIPLYDKLVLLTHKADGEPLETDRVVLLRDLTETISEKKKLVLDWETMDDIERTLSLRE